MVIEGPGGELRRLMERGEGRGPSGEENRHA